MTIAITRKTADIGRSMKIRYEPADIARACRKLNSMMGDNITPRTIGAVSKSIFLRRYPRTPMILMIPTSTMLEFTA